LLKTRFDKNLFGCSYRSYAVKMETVDNKGLLRWFPRAAYTKRAKKKPFSLEHKKSDIFKE